MNATFVSILDQKYKIEENIPGLEGENLNKFMEMKETTE